MLSLTFHQLSSQHHFSRCVGVGEISFPVWHISCISVSLYVFQEHKSLFLQCRTFLGGRNSLTTCCNSWRGMPTNYWHSAAVTSTFAAASNNNVPQHGLDHTASRFFLLLVFYFSCFHFPPLHSDHPWTMNRIYQNFQVGAKDNEGTDANKTETSPDPLPHFKKCV